MRPQDSPGGELLAPREEVAVRAVLDVLVEQLQPDALPADSAWRDTYWNCAQALTDALKAAPRRSRTR